MVYMITFKNFDDALNSHPKIISNAIRESGWTDLVWWNDGPKPPSTTGQRGRPTPSVLRRSRELQVEVPETIEDGMNPVVPA